MHSIVFFDDIFAFTIIIFVTLKTYSQNATTYIIMQNFTRLLLCKTRSPANSRIHTINRSARRR